MMANLTRKINLLWKLVDEFFIDLKKKCKKVLQIIWNLLHIKMGVNFVHLIFRNCWKLSSLPEV